MFGWLKRKRREKLAAQPFPPEWERILAANCGFFARLPQADRAELRRLILVFLAEKHFEGCAGFEITDEARVTIAANACLLLLRRRHDYYPDLVTILVYPSGFEVDHVEVDEYGIETRERVTNLGESWERGNVILSWDSARHGARDPRDGLNVVLHEFAHQLDGEDPFNEGAPRLDGKAEREAWPRVMKAEYQRLVEDVEAGRDTFIDEYGAENPAEFFAVCVETFFELPSELRAEHPELYARLQAYFKQDPASWGRAD